MKKAIASAVAVVSMMVASGAYGQQVSTGSTGTCLTIPMADTPPLCRTPTGYSGYLPQNPAAGTMEAEELDKAFVELSKEISAYHQSRAKYENLIKSPMVRKNLSDDMNYRYKNILDAAQVKINQYDDSFDPNAGDTVSGVYMGISEELQITAKAIDELSGYISDDIKSNVDEQNNIKARSEAAAQAVEMGKKSTFRKQLSSWVIYYIISAMLLVASKIYNNSQKPDALGAEFSAYGDNLNDEQIKIYRSVRGRAVLGDRAKTNKISILGYIFGLFLFFVFLVGAAPWYLIIAGVPAIGIWIHGVNVISAAHESKSEGRVREEIWRLHTKYKCPDCRSHFAVTFSKLGEVLISAIPRQSKKVGARNSEGRTPVMEAHWTEARYEVTKHEDCACCSYEKTYKVNETRQENRSSTTYYQ